QLYDRALSADEVAALAGETGDMLWVSTAGTVGFGNSIVCDSVGVPAYTSIQDAVDDAEPGDTVSVCPGTYAESVEIETSDLALMSTEGSAATTVAPSSGTAITLAGNLGPSDPDRPLDGITVQGFTLVPGAGAIALIALSGTPDDAPY